MDSKYVTKNIYSEVSQKKPKIVSALHGDKIGIGRIPGGGGTPLYKVYRYVPPQRVWFLSWSENGYRFWTFWSEIGYGYRGNVHESL